ncbi:putative exported domain protein [Bordetella holmesii 44057]|nr:putative exported domain protein [Bordetella holmesii 44057]
MRGLCAAALTLAVMLAPAPGQAHAAPASALSPAAAEMQRLALDAYVYLYPLVSMDLMRRQAISPKTAQLPGHAAANRFWMQRGQAAGSAWPMPTCCA